MRFFHVTSALGPEKPDSNANSLGLLISRNASSNTQHQSVKYVSERGKPFSESPLRILPIRLIVRGIVVNPTLFVRSHNVFSDSSGHRWSRTNLRLSEAFFGLFLMS